MDKSILKYRKRHKRCKYCKYLKIINPRNDQIDGCVGDWYECTATDKIIGYDHRCITEYSRMFCSYYEVDEKNMNKDWKDMICEVKKINAKIVVY